MSRLNNLYRKMIEFYRGDPARIQHFVKVHSFAKLIGEEEHLEEKTLYILEAAAYVHDIGIRPQSKNMAMKMVNSRSRKGRQKRRK